MLRVAWSCGWTLAGMLAAGIAFGQDYQGFEIPKDLRGSLEEGACPEGSGLDKCPKKPAARRPPLRPPPPAKQAAPPQPPMAPDPPPPPPPEPVLAMPRSAPPPPPFVKGELGDFIGANTLLAKNMRAGLRLGYRQLDLKHYFTLNPEADLRIWKFEFGLGLPLALELFDGAWDAARAAPTGFTNAGAFRSEDWNEADEYVRFLRYLRFGKKEDRLFLHLSQSASTTIGHGPLMRRYNVNIDPDSTRLAGELDMYNDYGGFEFVTNSLVHWNLLGMIAFVKPLSWFLDSDRAKSLSLGLSYVVDRQAPVTVKTMSSPTTNPFFLLGTDRPNAELGARLQAMGVDLEFKLLKTRQIDIKPFIDYSWFMPATPAGGEFVPSGGGGLTLGVLGRFNFGHRPVQALRAILEFRSFSACYLPGYFDTFYEVQKFVAHNRYRESASNSASLPPTKFQDVFVDRKGSDRHLGFYLELSYALVDLLSVSLALEGSDAASGNNFLAHLEVPALDWLKFFASYHHRSGNRLVDLLTAESGSRMAFASARLTVLPFLFFNLRYHYTFELREEFQDLTGDGLEQRTRLYHASHGWLADLELGWEF